MKQFPSISIVTPTYNCNLKLFKESLESIKHQKYPSSLIEHIIIDGGSTNDTLKLAKIYRCKIIKKPELIEYSQERMSLGIQAAKHELILILETDNVLIGNDWLQKTVLPFLEEEKIWCTFSMYNGYKKNSSLLTKYFALFGTNDCFLYYLDKVEKMPLDEKKYNKGIIIKETDNYYVTKFDPQSLPPMGDNGFMVRRKIIDKINKNPKKFLHVDAFYNVVMEGFEIFGVVKNSIIHCSKGSILDQYKNRILIKHLYYDKLRGKRSYLTFDPRSKKELFRLFLFIIFSITFIVPLMRSVKGFLKVREKAWFLHPLVSFIALFFYTTSELKFQLDRFLKKGAKLGVN